jgi:RHS repeat-associated protein
LLQKTTHDITPKYVDGLGLNGEETYGEFKTYHFDFLGSTVATTDESAHITAPFKYDTYGKMTEHIGNNFVILGYNGRDGVVTDRNGLLYMRARYYSPDMRRFINADILHGEISNAVTLNRYAYANGNPVSNTDPFGLAAEERAATNDDLSPVLTAEWEAFLDEYFAGRTTTDILINDDMRDALYQSLRNAIETAKRPNNIGKGTWAKQVAKDLQWVDDVFGASSKLAKGLKAAPWVGVAVDTVVGVIENRKNDVDWWRTGTDAVVDAGYGAATAGVSIWAGTKIGGAIGTAVSPGVGTAVGIGVGFVISGVSYLISDVIKINGKSIVDWGKEGLDWVVDGIRGWCD